MNADGYDYPALLDRYPVEENSYYFLIEGKRLIAQAFDLYKRMSKLKDGVKPKGRPKIEDYEYGIPIEDARYILPLACKTNLVVSMSGTQLFDLLQLYKSKEYQKTINPIIEQLKHYILPSLIDYLLTFVPDATEQTALLRQYFEEKLSKITNEQNVVCFNSYKDPIVRIGVGAVTSTNANPPSVIYEKWGEQLKEKASQVSNRVMGYGHFGISEQSRTTFGLMMSLITYHQYIRHRLPLNHRESLYDILKDNDREVVVPKTIACSTFRREYLELVQRMKQFRLCLLEHEKFQEDALLFLLNCEQIKVLSSTNARMDCEIMRERLCMNAQWEIRNLYLKKLQFLYPTAPEVYQYAGPSCLRGGGCKEGKLSCNNPKIIKELLQDIEDKNH
jgi:thymidylate synthase ThyX